MSREALVKLLENLPAGSIADNLRGKVVELLQGCWAEFTGSHQTSMEAYKLERAEEFEWVAPVLSFTIARHGATVSGSTREHLYHWSVDVEKKTAIFAEGTFRQVRPSAPRLRTDEIRRIVRQVCEHVQKGPFSPAIPGIPLNWKSEKELLIRPASLISAEGFGQTLAGRRKRARSILVDEMKAAGWVVANDKGAFVRFRKSNGGNDQESSRA